MVPILFLEIALQLYYHITTGSYVFNRAAIPIYESDDVRYYRVKPNLSYHQQTNEFDVIYYTNNQGLRSDHLKKDITIDKGDHIYRILFLGPSFTFGWGNNYEDMYVTLIANSITVKGKEVEIMNLGTPAQPMNAQLCWLRKTGYKFKPDMIIQTVYGDPLNVATNCSPISPAPKVKDGYLYMGDSWVPSFLKNSAIVFYGWSIFIFCKSRTPLGLGTELYEHATDPTQMVTDPEGTVKKYRDYIDFVRKTVSMDIPVVFIYIPFSYTVRPSDAIRWELRQQGGLPGDLRVLREKAKVVCELLAKRHIPFVNPTDELVLKDQERRMYYFLDVHFTPAGNKIVAEQAIPVIREVLKDESPISK
jgi:hypothetical protein